jgi:hypothetical protein
LHIKLSKIAYTTKSKTVSFTFNDGTDVYNGIDALGLLAPIATGIYTVGGQRLDAAAGGAGTLPQGFYIVKSADGSTRKVLVK